jgi:hypothetical protein
LARKELAYDTLDHLMGYVYWQHRIAEKRRDKMLSEANPLSHIASFTGFSHKEGQPVHVYHIL